MRPIARSFENPTDERPYLNEPNYYRLGYQLAAQLMNVEHLPGKERKRLRRSAGILHGDVAREGVPQSNRVRARAVAERTEREAGLTLAWYRQRTEARWWTFTERLTPPEERLERFLVRTVRPCLRLVIAASLRGEDDARAEELAAPLREAAAGGDLSYRALYNLACYEAGAEEEGRWVAALEYLRRALREAPGDRRGELIRWAGKDPSLGELRGRRELEETLESFSGDARE